MVNYSYDPSGNPSMQGVNVLVAPQIVGQPSNQIAVPGDSATFSLVVSDASGVTFQWKFNGTDLPGVTGDSLLLTNVSASNEGQYSVVVTNSAGSVTSASAALMLDSNGDGLPDSWEMANFGNLTSQRSAGDPDQDGVSNLDEFFDGTNPTSNNSFRPRLTAYSDAGGSVTVAPMKLSYGLGETVTLTATPFAPSVFVSWMGDLNGTSNPVTLTMNGQKTVRARFALAAPIPPGLVAFWRGETDANDLIGGYDGTFFTGTSVTAPSITASGKVGRAFNFDGTVYMQIPDYAALRPAQITIEAWVFPIIQSNTYQTIIARGSSTNDDDTWYLGIYQGLLHFWTSPDDLAGPEPIPLNQWAHLAASFDGTTKQLYVNGVQVATGLRPDALLYDAAVPVTIGSDWAFNASGQYFTGQVDEVAIYNRALTASEIADIYHADFVGKNITQPYFTSPSRLPDGILGARYTQPLTTILGTAPVSFSLVAGALPPGMTLSSAGVVSGVPDVPELFDFTVLATDAAGMATEHLCLLRVLQPVVPPTDLVAWWRGEPARSVIPDIIGGHNGHFFHGNTVAAPAYTADGKVGSAFTFDGTYYAQVPDAVELRPSEMTAEAWVFPTIQSNELAQAVIARGSSTNDDDTWWMGVYQGKLHFWSNHIGVGMVLLEAKDPIPLNQWTHLTMSFDGTTKRLYVNGAQVASQDGLGALVYDATVPVTIGSDWARNAPADLFNGRVDEVSLYSRALSSTEVLSIVDAGSAGKSTMGPYVNTPSRLPSAVVGQAYRQTFTSVWGTAPVSYGLLAESTLPLGLTLTSSGVLSGVPTNAGSFNFLVRATDAVGLFNEQYCSLQVFESVTAPAGLVGWWRAEGNALDSIGANAGTLRNGTVFAAGKVGQTFLLDGTDDCIEIPDAPALRPVSLTLEAWIMLDVLSLSGLRAIFCKPLGTGISDSYSLWLASGTLNGVVSDAAGLGPVLTTSFTLTLGYWYHVAYTFDDNADQQALYVDGIQVAIGGVTTSIAYDAQPLLLGRDTENGAPNFFFQGRIDEASIYNRALSGAEIASIYNAGPAGKRL